MTAGQPLGSRDRVGEYRIISVLGEGGMGVVYLAEDENLGRRVALKVIAPHLAHDPEFRQRFELEARSAAAIEHPNVIPVYAAGSANESFFLAMRFIDGTDLKALLAQMGRLDLEIALKVVDEVAAALDAAHAIGFVHRDVKPANILLEGTPGKGTSYLTDFGLTRGLADSGAQLTGTGQWIGTIDYVAPEQIVGQHVDARADIYALGCVFYEMLSGLASFAGNDMQKMWAHANRPIPALGGDLSALDAVVAQATAKDPAQRFTSAGALAKAARSQSDAPRLPAVSVAARAAVSGPAKVSSAPTRVQHRPRVVQPTAVMPDRQRASHRAPGRAIAIIGAALLLAGGMVGAAFVIAGGKSRVPSSTAARHAMTTAQSPVALGDWPGGTGYMAQLGSFTIKSDAERMQREASERGLGTGLLFSSNFSSLRPGYWVVFSGDFPLRSEAADRAARARALGLSPDAFPRWVVPR